MVEGRRVLIAPDSFKESLTALEVAQAIEEGFQQVAPEWTYEKVPMADGGEGTVQSVVDATAGEIKWVEVTNPMGDKIDAFYGLSGDGKQVIIELAAASGLELIEKSKRDPMKATSAGLGDLICAALDEDIEKIIIGIGGSATNDAGAGMLQHLGAQLLDENGKEVQPGGENLHKIEIIDFSTLDSRLKQVTIEVACDVNNPLAGKDGASYVYGPQKGASPEQVKELDENLTYFGELLERERGIDIIAMPGAGAAGGVGAALLALDANLNNGGDLIVDLLGLDHKMKTTDLVVTGEGGLNQQTIYGKTPVVISRLAKKYHLPVIAIVGSILEGYEAVYDEGIDAVFGILPKISDEETALADAYENIVRTARNIASLLKFSKYD